MEERDYYKLVRPYEDASNILKAKVQVFEHNLYEETGGKPIHSINARIKSKTSIEGKLAHRGYAQTAEEAREHLQDIAGIRIVCYFVEDIYKLSRRLRQQPDLIFIREADYIHSPKPNGYRSYHIILGVPVYSLDAAEYFPVEIQLRTIAMDFWASLEHRVSYKKHLANRDLVTTELLSYAETLKQIEDSFEKYRITPGS